MKKSILLLASAALLFAGCAKVENEEVVPVPEKGKRTITLKATVDEPNTRVSASINGDKATYSWQTGDAIAVWIDDGVGGYITNNPITAQNIGNDGSTADFPVTLDEGENLGAYAFYPHSVDCGLDNDEWVFGLNPNITYVKDATNMPMLGEIKSTGASFKAVGAVIKLTINNVPAEAAHLLFSAKDVDGSELAISGVFPISNGLITAGGQEGDHGVNIDFSGKRENDMVFYVPVPTGTYGGFEIEFDNANSSETLASKKVNFGSTGLTVHRNEIILAPALDLPVVVWHETFNTNNGTGGNDGNWYGSIATADVDSDLVWEFTSAKGAKQCIKFGTTGAGGSAISPALSVQGTAYITFKAGAWDGSSEGLTLNLAVIGSGSLNTPSVTLTKGAFTDYSITITGLTPSSQLKFYTESGKSRVFLDEVIVKANEADIRVPKTDPGLAFSAETATATIGVTFTAPTLTKPNDLDVVYSSTNTDVATVDPSTGAVSILAVGTTTIKATSAETAKYNADEASYELTVFNSVLLTLVVQGTSNQIPGTAGQLISELLPNDPDCSVTGYTFTGWSTTEYATAQTNEPTYVSETATLPENGMTIYAVFAKHTQSQENLPLTYDQQDFSGRGSSGGSGAPFTHNEDDASIAFSGAFESTEHVRIYNGSTVTFSSERTITKIEITCTSKATSNDYGPNKLTKNSSSDPGSYTYSSYVGTWQGSANSVTLKATGQARAKSIVITFASAPSTLGGWTTSPVAD